MEEADRDWVMIRMVGGECFFWYRLTRVARTKGCKTIVMCFLEIANFFIHFHHYYLFSVRVIMMIISA